MKNKKILMLSAIAAMTTLASCGGGKSYDAKTINVKLLLGGYGSEWLTETIKQFENTYKAQGYKVNLLTPNKQVTGNNVRSDLLAGYKKKNIDLYFTGSLAPSRIGGGQDGVLAMELDTTVYNQKALRFDGTEEDKTVAQKLNSSFTDSWYKYNGTSYNFFYQRAIGGLVVNFDKLKKCGYDELPVTTNQFLDMVHGIRENQSRVRPFTYVANTGYANVGLQTWFTQLAGLDKWYTFQSMNTADGNYDFEHGPDVFTWDEWVDAGEKVFNMFDYNNFLKGSKNYSIAQAHASLMTEYEDGGAVFLFDGDWALNETRADYPSDTQLSKLRFINTPINSSLGVEIWGTGTRLNIPTEEAVDKLLAKVVTLADENKEVSEIIETVKNDTSLGYTLTTEEVERVCQARGVYYNRGLDTGTACVPVGLSDEHKDMVSKLLRMIASDDFSKLYFEKSRCFSPYSSVIDESETLLPFSEGHKQIATNKYATGILPAMTGLRGAIGGELNRFFPGQTAYYHDVALASEVTAYDDKTGLFDKTKLNLYTNQAQSELDKAHDLVTSNWDDWTAPFKN